MAVVHEREYTKKNDVSCSTACHFPRRIIRSADSLESSRVGAGSRAVQTVEAELCRLHVVNVTREPRDLGVCRVHVVESGVAVGPDHRFCGPLRVPCSCDLPHRHGCLGVPDLHWSSKHNSRKERVWLVSARECIAVVCSAAMRPVRTT
jgi:hypothetical protein